jgi:hypothetical protein
MKFFDGFGPPRLVGTVEQPAQEMSETFDGHDAGKPPVKEVPRIKR